MVRHRTSDLTTSRPSEGGKTVFLSLVVVLLEYLPALGGISGEIDFLGYKLSALVAERENMVVCENPSYRV